MLHNGMGAAARARLDLRFSDQIKSPFFPVIVQTIRVREVPTTYKHRAARNKIATKFAFSFWKQTCRFGPWFGTYRAITIAGLSICPSHVTSLTAGRTRLSYRCQRPCGKSRRIFVLSRVPFKGFVEQGLIRPSRRLRQAEDLVGIIASIWSVHYLGCIPQQLLCERCKNGASLATLTNRFHVEAKTFIPRSWSKSA